MPFVVSCMYLILARVVGGFDGAATKLYQQLDFHESLTLNPHPRPNAKNRTLGSSSAGDPALQLFNMDKLEVWQEGRVDVRRLVFPAGVV
ncbi:hypothetical protein F4779DRAFT_128019 [Xylariaceae sp. FL0662B]|nr:hypothetical protein F4779DRAFT_128019 [Xylariaceae sp. FL0662B]